jgi:hypothetical protein
MTVPEYAVELVLLGSETVTVFPAGQYEVEFWDVMFPALFCPMIFIDTLIEPGGTATRAVVPARAGIAVESTSATARATLLKAPFIAGPLERSTHVPMREQLSRARHRRDPPRVVYQPSHWMNI